MKNQKYGAKAQKRAKEMVEFRIHLTTFIAVNSLLAVINLSLAPENIWFIWPLFGWGIAIIIHAFKVNYSSKSLKEKMIEKELEKINQ